LFRETIRIIVLGLRATEHPNPTQPAPRVKARTSTNRKRSS
jgi:hypothetical protein